VTSALLIVAVVAAVVLARQDGRHPTGLTEIGERPETDGPEPDREEASDDVVVDSEPVLHDPDDVVAPR
jgi:hypothetical protein